jgi:hypothetical protein
VAEVQQMGANQAQCWQCGEVVYKGIKNCPKCGAVSPAVSMATVRKGVLIFLRVGMPVCIVSLIAGIIMFVMWQVSMERVADQLLGGPAVGDSAIIFSVIGPYISSILIILGFAGVVCGPIAHFKLKKWDRQQQQQQREQQFTATREDQ